MITLKLYGELAEKYGKEFKMHVNTLSRALSLMQANFPDFSKHLQDSDQRLAGYEVWANEENLEGKEEEFAIQRGETIFQIIPVIKGASSTGRIIAGVVLVVVGAIVGVVYSWTGVGAQVGVSMIVAGVGLIAGGIAEKLTKKPVTKESTESDKAESYLFSGPVNNGRQGAPVPVGYGKMIVGSVVISASISPTDIPV